MFTLLVVEKHSSDSVTTGIFCDTSIRAGGFEKKCLNNKDYLLYSVGTCKIVNQCLFFFFFFCFCKRSHLVLD